MVDPAAIGRASEPLFRQISQEKWQAAMALLNLRSFGNSTLEDAKQHVVLTVTEKNSGQWVIGQPGKWVEFMLPSVVLDGHPGDVPMDAAGVIFDRPGHYADTYGYVIFRNSHIIYRGGKVTLVNTFFDNCTFDIQQDDHGVLFAKAVLGTDLFSNLAIN